MPKSRKRKFGGKIYWESMLRYNKQEAQEAAESVRKHGGLARITKEGKIYIIWQRG